ncbi:hypothetical protein ACHAXA_011103 [Cyclostephanos tholiformis]|uniref:Uncharacterized protein n=1 Tax=Cyclostephanos tholiformis TaxID=382380 RepID=A0ABD3SG37_9STRA
MIAASFEEVKPELIHDDNGIPVLSEQISESFERHGEKEEKLEEVDDVDDAPLPSGMIAASYEEVKPEFIHDDNDIPVLSEQITASFEGHGEEEEKLEEVDEEDDAPLPPGMIAEFFEENDDEEAKLEDIEDEYAPVPPGMIAALYDTDCKAKQNDKKIPAVFEYNVGCIVNNAQEITNLLDASSTFPPNIGTESLPNGGTPADTDNQEKRIAMTSHHLFPCLMMARI